MSPEAVLWSFLSLTFTFFAVTWLVALPAYALLHLVGFLP